MWTVRISDGKVLSHQLYDTTYADLAVSRDAALIAANSAHATGYIAGPTAAHTIIRRTADGSLIASFDPSYEVLGFSADDQFALVATSPYASGVATHLAVVDVRTGHVVWSYSGDQELSRIAVEPAGAGFAIMLQTPNDQNVHPSVSVLLVTPYGASPAQIAIGIPGNFLRP